MNSVTWIFSVFCYKLGFKFPPEAFPEEPTKVGTGLARQIGAGVHEGTGRGEKSLNGATVGGQKV